MQIYSPAKVQYRVVRALALGAYGCYYHVCLLAVHLLFQVVGSALHRAVLRRCVGMAVTAATRFTESVFDLGALALNSKRRNTRLQTTNHIRPG